MKKASQIQIEAGSTVSIPVGTKIKTKDGEIKAERPFTVTVRDVEFTRAGNCKVTWRGHRSLKTAIIKLS